MAKNDKDKSFDRDGRSLEEQLASLDALSGESKGRGSGDATAPAASAQADKAGSEPTARAAAQPADTAEESTDEGASGGDAAARTGDDAGDRAEKADSKATDDEQTAKTTKDAQKEKATAVTSDTGSAHESSGDAEAQVNEGFPVNPWADGVQAPAEPEPPKSFAVGEDSTSAGQNPWAQGGPIAPAGPVPSAFTPRDATSTGAGTAASGGAASGGAASPSSSGGSSNAFGSATTPSGDSGAGAASGPSDDGLADRTVQVRKEGTYQPAHAKPSPPDSGESAPGGDDAHTRTVGIRPQGMAQGPSPAGSASADRPQDGYERTVGIRPQQFTPQSETSPVGDPKNSTLALRRDTVGHGDSRGDTSGAAGRAAPVPTQPSRSGYEAASVPGQSGIPPAPAAMSPAPAGTPGRPAALPAPRSDAAGGLGTTGRTDTPAMHSASGSPEPPSTLPAAYHTQQDPYSSAPTGYGSSSSPGSGYQQSQVTYHIGGPGEPGGGYDPRGRQQSNDPRAQAPQPPTPPPAPPPPPASAASQSPPAAQGYDAAVSYDQGYGQQGTTSSGYLPPTQGATPPRALPAGPGSASVPGTQEQDRPRPGSTESLDSAMLLGERRPEPSGGWRRFIYKASIGLIHPGESPAEIRRQELLARVRTQVASGHHRVAVLSLKGGVGKTTTTVGLGSTLATFRGDRVIAVDANPDRGTLSDKVRRETEATVRNLLNERENIQRYADVRAFTSQASSRLEVLASDRDPAVSEAFSDEDYRNVAEVLEHYYSICITDCGTGLLHAAMAGVLGLADQIVVVSSPSVDGARSASATLDWLQAHSYGSLVRNAIVVLSAIRPRSKSGVDLDRLEAHFAARTRGVVRVPYDPHLEEGAEIELDELNPATVDAYLTLAAAVGDGFAAK